MKINKLKINAYGKLQNKEIDLSNKINIIHGENESGKSTILKFIINSFYGTSKNKKGKDFSDYEQYKPWNTEDFSGKLKYELDNGESFEIYREFGKKNPKIYNKDLEDISKQFNIDKNKGNEFFYEQTKIDEDLFLATSAILQEEIRLEKNVQNTLIQKMTNIVGTGSDNVSYKRTIERLNRRQLDEVGTERSREKPINILEQKITDLKNKKEELKEYENYKLKINSEKENIIKNISKNKIKYEIIKELNKIKNEQKIENEKIKIKEGILNENSEKINEIKNQIFEIKNSEDKNKKNNEKQINKQINKLNNKINITFLSLIIINIIWYLFLNKNIENNILKNMFFITIPIFIIISYFYKKSLKNKISNNFENENNNKKQIINNLNNEISILEKNKQEIIEQIEENKNKNNYQSNLSIEKIKNNYLNKISNSELDNLLNLNNSEYEEEKIKEKINELELELHKINFNLEDIEEKYNTIVNIDEQLANLEEEYKEVQKLNTSINLVKEILAQSYEEMQNSVSPKFTEDLSKNIKEITKGKYKKVKFNDEQGMIVEVENGNYISAERLSSGTIDQLYLSLRFAMLEGMPEEKIPIILDEAFSHFDDTRLKNVLNYINNIFGDRQIIIFTCNNREIEALNSLNICYNLINL